MSQQDATTTTSTIRSPPYTYIHLTLLTTPTSNSPFDALTARKYLTAALSQFLGLTGTAISVDILKLESQDVWIRVPREDGSLMVEAVSGWVEGSETASVGWRVRAVGEWLAGVGKGTGRDLFDD
ncbi:hypothetical protein MMC09_004687 [Bachmanniomyces sp. S44760]|nr:hypothetical protein [Bachmanniomyces sp. S44760]